VGGAGALGEGSARGGGARRVGGRCGGWGAVGLGEGCGDLVEAGGRGEGGIAGPAMSEVAEEFAQVGWAFSGQLEVWSAARLGACR